jgi:hypothetical protein
MWVGRMSSGGAAYAEGRWRVQIVHGRLLPQRRKKQFFFEKKNQKTFVL